MAFSYKIVGLLKIWAFSSRFMELFIHNSYVERCESAALLFASVAFALLYVDTNLKPPAPSPTNSVGNVRRSEANIFKITEK